MYRITAILVFLIVLMLFLVQLFTEQLRAVDDAHLTLQQMSQVIEENQKELKEIEEEYKKTLELAKESNKKITENINVATNTPAGSECLV